MSGVTMRGLTQLFYLLLLVWCQQCVCQPNYAQSYTFDKMPLEDKALFLSDSLVQHPVVFRKLLGIADKYQQLVQPVANDPKWTLLVNSWLEQLPEVLKSNFTVDVVTILADELRRVNVSDINQKVLDNLLSPGTPQYVQEMGDALWTRLNIPRLTQRILTSRSATEVFNLADVEYDFVCYRDVMALLDAARGVQVPPLNILNFTTPLWALTMLDAMGIPPAGVLEGGSRDWEGAQEECQRVHVHLEPGDILANKPLNYSVDFRGQYCRVLFKPDPEQSSSVLRTMWGVCVPDSCYADGLYAFIKSSMKKLKLPLPLVSIECYHQNQGNHYVSNFSPPCVNPANCPGEKVSFYPGCLVNRTGLDLPGFINCFLTTFDTDKNREINSTEWMTSTAYPAVPELVSPVQSFFTLDINKDRVLDHQDLQYIFHIFPHDKDTVSDENFRQGWTSLFS